MQRWCDKESISHHPKYKEEQRTYGREKKEMAERTMHETEKCWWREKKNRQGGDWGIWRQKKMMEKGKHNSSVRKGARLEAPVSIPLQPHSLSGSHSLQFLLPTFSPLAPFSPVSIPHPCSSPVSGSPLNKSGRDNSTIVTLVWEPWNKCCLLKQWHSLDPLLHSS